MKSTLSSHINLFIYAGAAHQFPMSTPRGRTTKKVLIGCVILAPVLLYNSPPRLVVLPASGSAVPQFLHVVPCAF